MSPLLPTVSIVLIVFGLLLRYWRGRRKFYRRNAAGIEGFSNYHRSVLTRSFESLLLLISKVLILIGLLLLLVLTCNQRWMNRAHRSLVPRTTVTRHSEKSITVNRPGRHPGRM